MISHSTGVRLDGWVLVVDEIAGPRHWRTARSARIQQGPLALSVIEHIGSVVAGVVA
jgi:hypothetical protein